MAGSKGNKSESSKRYYNSYNPEKQRRLRLERHLKKHPEDAQAKEALKNPKLRGPRPSGSKLGWVDRRNPLYDDLKGKADAQFRAWMSSIMKKAEKQHNHETNYAPKSERAKGGKEKTTADAKKAKT